ncbi:coiled-coil-helix-coiled-coil-helix domain containing 6 [Cricetulus griseus]
MGSAESAEARRVSFEMDEEERVRVLQGIRLSESVVNRMKDSSQPSAGPCPVPTVPAPTTPAPTSPPSTTSVPSMPVPIAPPPSSSDPSEGAFKAPPTDSKVPRAESGGGQQPSAVKEDLKRFQQEQAVVQDELAKVAKREKEAVEKHLKASLPKKRASPTREQQKSALLAPGLEWHTYIPGRLEVDVIHKVPWWLSFLWGWGGRTVLFSLYEVIWLHEFQEKNGTTFLCPHDFFKSRVVLMW